MRGVPLRNSEIGLWLHPKATIPSTASLTSLENHTLPGLHLAPAALFGLVRLFALMPKTRA
jgi:hypothetical protein